MQNKKTIFVTLLVVLSSMAANASTREKIQATGMNLYKCRISAQPMNNVNGEWRKADDKAFETEKTVLASSDKDAFQTVFNRFLYKKITLDREVFLSNLDYGGIVDVLDISCVKQPN